METKRTAIYPLLGLLLCLFTLPASLVAGNDPGESSIGFRFGWGGGSNGLTYRCIAAPYNAFEFSLGYSPKEGRMSETLDPIRKGNTLLGVSYSPFVYMEDQNVGFLFNLTMGTRARYHHYRTLEMWKNGTPKITADFFAGGGAQLELAESVEIFCDLGIKYYNKINNLWTWGIESGAGLRVKI